MVATNFTLVSGTYTDEQDLLSELDFFIVNTIGGWTRVKTIADTATDKNIAYYSDGSVPGDYDRFWLRIQAASNQLRFYGMSYFDAGSETGSDTFGGTNQQTPLTVSTSSGIYWLAANEDSVHVLIERSSDSLSLHGGFGLFSTYHTSSLDPKPFYVFGQASLDSTFVDNRLQAYGPRSWGSDYNTTFSGTIRNYNAAHPTHLQYGAPNPRSGYLKLVEPVFYAAATFGALEVRGEVSGLYMCGGLGATTGAVVEVNFMAPTVSGMYLMHRHSDTYTWAIGPVTVSGGV